MEWVSYKVCEKSALGYVGLYFLSVMADVDGSNSDESDFQDEGENDSGSESDISVSTVNTEDLSDLSFSEDEDGDGEVGWSRDPAPVNTIPFTSRTGAVSRIPEDGTAKDFFNLFVSDEVFEAFVEETNRYARQCIAHKPDRRWRETNVEEMRAYFGLNILFGIKKLPDTDLYWSKDVALGVPYVQKVMPRDRFDKLTQYLHINDNEKAAPRGHRDHDKLFKIRPLFEVVNSKFLEEYQPSQNLSVDEAMIAFRGQLAMKQYLPMKPVKRGIKVWMCADASNGFVCNMQVYTGKKDGGATEHGLGYRVVQDLTRPFINKNHHVFADNFFTSIPLACDLLRDNTYFCGTVRFNRHGFPSSLKPTRADVKALRKGESKFCRRGNLVASVWKDTKLVHFLSTQSNPVGEHTVNRKQKDRTIVQIPTVPVVVDYNKNMGGVDLSDQQRQYYAVGRKSRKWWRYLLWFFIDVSIVNAHILECQADNHRSRTQLKFRLELSKMLIGDFSSRSLTVAEGRFTCGHWPVATTRGRCKRCLKRKSTKFCQISCMACNKRICLDCFANHTDDDLS